MLSYEEALGLVLARTSPLPAVTVALGEATGRVLAETIHAQRDLPPADNSAMDGYAFLHQGEGAGAVVTAIGTVTAGQTFAARVEPGQAVRIMTGAPLPQGCDTVVPLEDVVVDGTLIRLLRAPRAGQHVRYQGEEVRTGDVVLTPGTPLYSGEIGFLAAVGADWVRVYPAPRVALLTTGDELVELGAEPAAGQLINSNSWLLAARLREEGCTVVRLGPARDEADDLHRLLGQGLEYDLLLTTGGVSVGDRDLVRPTLERHGFVAAFWKVAIKPGKPVLFGTVGTTPVFGLPGNPAAAAATFELFVRPALRRLAGFAAVAPPRLRATLGASVAGGEKRQRFLWGRLEEADGSYRFIPSARQGSGQNRSLIGVQALLPVPGNSDELVAGRTVDVWLLRLPPGGTIR